MAYADLERSPVAGLLSPAHRHAVADTVNAAILALTNAHTHTAATPAASASAPASATATASASGVKAAGATAAAPLTLPSSALERVLRHVLCTRALIDRETQGMAPPFEL